MHDDPLTEYIATVASAKHFMRLRQGKEAKRRCHQGAAIRFQHLTQRNLAMAQAQLIPWRHDYLLRW